MNCFSTIRGAKDFKDHFMNVLIYIALVPLWRHSKNGKNQEDLENGMIRALEPANQKLFPLPGNGVFGFSTDLCATIILQTMRNFINKNSNSSLKL